MALGGTEACVLQHRSDQLVVESKHFVKQLTVFDVVALLVSVVGQSSVHQLVLFHSFENQEI